MRNLFKTMAAFLIALLFVYGGLNLAERGINEIMALDRFPAAFTVRKEENGALAITFGGKTVTINLSHLVERLRSQVTDSPDLQ